MRLVRARRGRDRSGSELPLPRRPTRKSSFEIGILPLVRGLAGP